MHGTSECPSIHLTELSTDYFQESGTHQTGLIVSCDVAVFWIVYIHVDADRFSPGGVSVARSSQQQPKMDGVLPLRQPNLSSFQGMTMAMS